MLTFEEGIDIVQEIGQIATVEAARFNLIRAVIEASWSLLLDSSVYMVFGILPF